jgi:hypothetical protein
VSDVHEQDCPLCETPAKYVLHNFEADKHFRCAICKDFVITSAAEDRLINSLIKLNWQQQLSKQSTSLDEGNLLYISAPSVSEQQVDLVYDAIRSDPQPRANWIQR